MCLRQARNGFLSDADDGANGHNAEEHATKGDEASSGTLRANGHVRSQGAEKRVKGYHKMFILSGFRRAFGVAGLNSPD